MSYKTALYLCQYYIIVVVRGGGDWLFTKLGSPLEYRQRYYIVPKELCPKVPWVVLRFANIVRNSRTRQQPPRNWDLVWDRIVVMANLKIHLGAALFWFFHRKNGSPVTDRG